MNKLEKALSGLLSYSEHTSCLAQALAYASKKGRVSYDEVEKIVNDNVEDILLLGNEWRLLLPVRTVKSAAWEDRLLLAEPGELYGMPNIIRYLVEEAEITGCWDPGHAVAKLFKEGGEVAWRQIPELVEELGQWARNYRITASQIKTACNELGLGDRIDALIAELKGSGVMSPKLGSLAEVSRAGMPIYELNPSLFIQKYEDTDSRP